VRRAEVLETWIRAVREQLPGMAAAPSAAQAPVQPAATPADWLQRQQCNTGASSPVSGAGAHTVSASGPTENPHVLRDIINLGSATGIDACISQLSSYALIHELLAH
jgi:hypothetical protein